MSAIEDIDVNDLGEKIVRVIKTIYDPEIPVDVYELGLIYDVMVSTDRDVKVLMTLTSPNCPVAESLPKEMLFEREFLKDRKWTKAHLLKCALIRCEQR